MLPDELRVDEGVSRDTTAFNTVFSAVLGSQPGGDSKVQVFYAGDDAGAKDTVRRLAESIGVRAGGWRPACQRSLPGAARHAQHLARLRGRPGHEHRAAVGHGSVSCTGGRLRQRTRAVWPPRRKRGIPPPRQPTVRDTILNIHSN
jgi:hypothetical protein